MFIDNYCLYSTYSSLQRVFCYIAAGYFQLGLEKEIGFYSVLTVITYYYCISLITQEVNKIGMMIKIYLIRQLGNEN